jgi:sugar lactone lactonase YvrE
MPHRRRAPLVATGAACGEARARPSQGAQDRAVAGFADGVATGVSSPGGARFVQTILGFEGPESVRYDAEADVFYVSNIAGYGSARDGNGFITRVSAADPRNATILVQGGRGGATLDAPKGLALHGDTLWVADIDALRGFDRRTGAPLATIDFAPRKAVQLNDVAIGPDGAIHVTDTGILMVKAGVIHTGPDRIFTVGANRAISETVADSLPGLPNGIAWDPAGKRWIVISFHQFVGKVVAMPDGQGAAQVLWRGSPRLDGVEVLGDGSILFTSWGDSSLHLLSGGEHRQLVRQVPEAADIGIDTRRNRVAIPLSSLGRVQLWSLGDSGAGNRER